MLQNVTARRRAGSTMTLSRYPTEIRLGDLLLHAGLLNEEQHQEALRLAATQKLHMGQVLMMCGRLNQHDLQSALDAQSILRDKALDYGLVIKSLKIACHNKISLEQALQENGAVLKSSSPTNKLGQLLLEATVISEEQFSKALQRSIATGLPLGRVLVLHNALSATLLTVALEIQVRIRDEMLDRSDAIDAIKVAAGKFETATEPDRFQEVEALLSGRRIHTVKLGELLISSGILSEQDVMNALELSLAIDVPIGEALIKEGFLSPDLLTAALKLQSLVDEKSIDVAGASNLLSRMKDKGLRLEEAASDLACQPAPAKISININQLLALGGIVKAEDIHDAFENARNNPQIVLRVLMMSGQLDEHAVKIVQRSYQLLMDGLINQNEAAILLDYCVHKKAGMQLTVDQAIKELGWSVDRHSSSNQNDKSDSFSGSGTGSDSATDEILKIAEAAAGSTENQMFASDMKHDENIGGASGMDEILGFPGRPAAERQGSPHAENATAAQSLELADVYERLAKRYVEMGDFAEAVRSFHRLIMHRLAILGPNYQGLADDLRGLASSLCTQENLSDAERVLIRLLKLMKESPDCEPAAYADNLSMLAGVYFQLEKFAECETLLKGALQIRQNYLQSDDPTIADNLRDYARLLRKLNRKEEAESLYVQSRLVLAKSRSRND